MRSRINSALRRGRASSSFCLGWYAGTASGRHKLLLTCAHPSIILYLVLGSWASWPISPFLPTIRKIFSSGGCSLQRSLKDKVAMMSRLQAALEQDALPCWFNLRGLRGDCYHEVLLRMRDDNGALIFPNSSCPIAQEFGLSSRVDLWVLSVR